MARKGEELEWRWKESIFDDGLDVGKEGVVADTASHRCSHFSTWTSTIVMPTQRQPNPY